MAAQIKDIKSCVRQQNGVRSTFADEVREVGVDDLLLFVSFLFDNFEKLAKGIMIVQCSAFIHQINLFYEKNRRYMSTHSTIKQNLL